MTERWVVGVDGSFGSRSALEWALRHASPRNADVTVVLASHRPALTRVLSAAHVKREPEAPLAVVALRELEASIADIVAGRDVQRQVVEGAPGKALTSAAADSSLLVVGRHGTSGNWRHILGSVSRYCVVHSTVPTVVVPTDWDGQETHDLVVGFDGSQNARAALRWGLAFADADADATVRAVIALEVAPWLSVDVIEERLQDELRAEERRLVDLIDDADPSGSAQREIVVRDARVALSHAAETTDLVVVGAHGAGRVSAVLPGSVSTWMLDTSTRPIVVVPSSSQKD